MFETFKNGAILGSDHKTSVDIRSRVSEMSRDPEAVLVEAPVNDGAWRASGAVEADEAMEWAHQNNVPVETFDAATQNIPSRDKYDMDGVKRIVTSISDPNKLREQLEREHPEFYREMLVEREAEMAENIRYHARSYNTVLVVVGEAHVPALLERL